jgi:hypothetical protein
VAKADKSVALLIERGGDKIFVPVRMGGSAGAPKPLK